VKPGSRQVEAPPLVNGWTLYAHPLFLDQVERLAAQVERLRARDPGGYRARNPTKRLAAIAKLALEVIPQDPARTEYRQGDSLGAAHRHWFRAKFFQQYRLFFRYHQASRIIVYGWVNDIDTRRAHESADDAYRVFQRMLARGSPPGDWNALLAEARNALPRMKSVVRRGAP
jgi:toxin YhaV